MCGFLMPPAARGDSVHRGILTGSRCAAAVRDSSARSAAEFGQRRRRTGFKQRQHGERPSDRLLCFLCRDSGINRGKREFSTFRQRFQDADVGHDHRRPSAAGAALRTAGEMPAARLEVELLHEAARRRLHDDENLPRMRRDLRRAAGAGQAGLRLFVASDDRAVEVAEAVDLRGPEKADVDATGLEVVAEDIGERNDAGRGFRELAVSDGKRQHIRPRADRARLVDQHEFRRMREPREVAGSARQADADEADLAVREQPRGSDRHHLVAGVFAHATHPHGRREHAVGHATRARSGGVLARKLLPELTSCSRGPRHLARA